MKKYSTSFIESQIAYYAKNVLSGNFQDRNMIVGLLHHFEDELKRRKRSVEKKNPSSN